MKAHWNILCQGLDFYSLRCLKYSQQKCNCFKISVWRFYWNVMETFDKDKILNWHFLVFTAILIWKWGFSVRWHVLSEMETFLLLSEQPEAEEDLSGICTIRQWCNYARHAMSARTNIVLFITLLLVCLLLVIFWVDKAKQTTCCAVFHRIIEFGERPLEI